MWHQKQCHIVDSICLWLCLCNVYAYWSSRKCIWRHTSVLYELAMKCQMGRELCRCICLPFGSKLSPFVRWLCCPFQLFWWAKESSIDALSKIINYIVSQLNVNHWPLCFEFARQFRTKIVKIATKKSKVRVCASITKKFGGILRIRNLAHIWFACTFDLRSTEWLARGDMKKWRTATTKQLFRMYVDCTIPLKKTNVSSMRSSRVWHTLHTFCQH